MGALSLHENVSAISGNVSAILGVCGGMRPLAKQVKTDGHRKVLEEMAEAWRMVAAEADNER
jgi:glutamine amidotransferase PdxT